MGFEWGPTFVFFKSLVNNIVYTLGIDVYLYKNPCRTKVLCDLIFREVGTCVVRNQNTHIPVIVIFALNFQLSNTYRILQVKKLLYPKKDGAPPGIPL